MTGRIVEAGLRALVASSLVGFVVFLMIGGIRSPYALLTLGACAALFVILWPILVLVSRRSIVAAGSDPSPLIGDASDWVAGRVRTDDGISGSSEAGDD